MKQTLKINGKPPIISSGISFCLPSEDDEVEIIKEFYISKTKQDESKQNTARQDQKP